MVAVLFFLELAYIHSCLLNPKQLGYFIQKSLKQAILKNKVCKCQMSLHTEFQLPIMF